MHNNRDIFIRNFVVVFYAYLDRQTNDGSVDWLKIIILMSIAGFRTVVCHWVTVCYIKYLEGESAGDNSTGTQNGTIGLGKKKNTFITSKHLTPTCLHNYKKVLRVVWFLGNIFFITSYHCDLRYTQLGIKTCNCYNYSSFVSIN